MKRTTIGALVLAAATAAIVPACGGHTSFAARPAAAVSQRDGGQAGLRQVTFSGPNSASPTALAPNCDPAQPSVCLQPLNLDPGAMRGDLTGSSVTSGVTIQRNGKFPSASLLAFTGRAKGCGTGGLLLVVRAAFDPSTFATRGSWQVYGHQGTGDLSGVTGEGTLVGDAAAFHFHGRIRCR